MPCAHGIHVRTENTKDVQALLAFTYPLSYNDGLGQGLQCSMVMIPTDIILCRDGVRERGNVQTLGENENNKTDKFSQDDRRYGFCPVVTRESKPKKHEKKKISQNGGGGTGTPTD